MLGGSMLAKYDSKRGPATFEIRNNVFKFFLNSNKNTPFIVSIYTQDIFVVTTLFGPVAYGG